MKPTYLQFTHTHSYTKLLKPLITYLMSFEKSMALFLFYTSIAFCRRIILHLKPINKNNNKLYCNNNINNTKKNDINYCRMHIAALPKSKAFAGGARTYHI